MLQGEFEQRHAGDWQRFEAWLVTRARRRRKDPAPDPTALPDSDVPRLYRQLCAQLAVARERQYGPDLVDRINRLVLDGHHALYGARADSIGPAFEFLVRDFPRLVRAEAAAVWAGIALFFGPFIGLAVAIQFHPELASVILGPAEMAQMQEMYSADAHQIGMRAASTNMEMFGVYIWNNIRIGFQTFAGGIFLGLGSIFFLLYNGIFIGAIFGHLNEVGLGRQLWSFTAGHGAMELTAIALSGAAGLIIGAALLAPGRRSRRAALVERGRVALMIMMGAAVMFFIAALIEAFWSPLNLADPWPKYAVGGFMWIVVLAYFGFAGRGGGRPAGPR
jgi:uncharacterized membrane protein SpoIIM required for sporulation